MFFTRILSGFKKKATKTTTALIKALNPALESSGINAHIQSGFFVLTCIRLIHVSKRKKDIGRHALIAKNFADKYYENNFLYKFVFECSFLSQIIVYKIFRKSPIPSMFNRLFA